MEALNYCEVDESWTLEEIARICPPPGWVDFFAKTQPIIAYISSQIEDTQFYPLRQDVFKAFDLTPMNEVKVVIIGQDPYPQTMDNGLPLAQGLAFSVPRDQPIPRSLNNIFKHMEQTLPNFNRPSSGDLTSWATQGVLLLNAALTVVPGHPGSHEKLWRPFVREVLRTLSQSNSKIIYLLWGSKAKSLRSSIMGDPIIFESSHPVTNTFSMDFSQINQILQAKALKSIDWNLSSP